MPRRNYRRKRKELQDYRKIEGIKDYKRKREELRREAMRNIERARELKRLADRAELEESRLFELFKKGKKLPKVAREYVLEELKRVTFRDALERLERIQDIETKGNKVLEQIKEDAQKIEVLDVERMPPRAALRELSKPHRKLARLEKRIKEWEKKEKARRKLEIKREIERERYEKAEEAERLYKALPPTPKEIQRVVKKVTKPEKRFETRKITLEEEIKRPERWTRDEVNRYIRDIQKQLSLIHEKGGEPAREASRLIHEIAKITLKGKRPSQKTLNEAEKLRLSVLPAYLRAVPISDISKQRLEVLQKWNNVLIQARKRKAIRPDEYRELFNAILKARVENKPVDSKHVTRIKELVRMEAPLPERKRAPPPERAASPSEIAESLAPREKVRKEIMEERRELATEMDQIDFEDKINKMFEDNNFLDFIQKVKLEEEGRKITGFEFLQNANFAASRGRLSIDELNNAKAIIKKWKKEKGEK